MTLGSFQEVKSFLGGRSASSEHVEKKRGGGGAQASKPVLKKTSGWKRRPPCWPRHRTFVSDRVEKETIYICLRPSVFSEKVTFVIL